MTGLPAVTSGHREGARLESAYRSQLWLSPASFRLNAPASRLERVAPLSAGVRRVSGELRVVPRKHGLSSPFGRRAFIFVISPVNANMYLSHTLGK